MKTTILALILTLAATAASAGTPFGFIEARNGKTSFPVYVDEYSPKIKKSPSTDKPIYLRAGTCVYLTGDGANSRQGVLFPDKSHKTGYAFGFISVDDSGLDMESGAEVGLKECPAQ